MIGTVKNADGYILGLVEWNLVNEHGQFSDKSEYIYIADIWVHGEYKKFGIFKELIRIIDDHPYAKDAKFVYWDFLRDEKGRRRTNDASADFIRLKQSKIYDRRHIADKILKREAVKC